MGVLRLAVLGPPEVFHGDSRLSFALRKAQALLLYLAVEGGMHPRGKLAAFLWPDSEPHAARTALRNAIALLRGLLADLDAAPAVPSHLLSQGDLIGLNPQAPLELDLDVVQQAWKEAQLHSTIPTEPQCAALVAKLQHALSLVRGPFLEGFWLGEDAPFDTWVQQHQQQWQVRLQLLCDRLSSWHEAAGEQEQARATLLRWLALDPLSEEAYRRLMRVYLALGDATAAWQVYTTCRARPGGRGAQRAGLRDEGTLALSAASGGPAGAAGGGERPGGATGRPVADRTGAHPARAAGALPRSAGPHRG